MREVNIVNYLLKMSHLKVWLIYMVNEHTIHHVLMQEKWAIVKIGVTLTGAKLL